MPIDCEIRELVEFAKPSRVDRLANGAIVLRRCKYLGERSVNVNKDGTSNVYPRSMRQATEGLYDGAKVYVNHPDRKTPGQERKVEDQIARLHGPFEHLEEGSFADVVINPKHPLAEQVAWDAEHSPDSLGLSHNAQGYGRTSGKSFMVEGMRKVRSVDMVPAGATTRGMFESQHEESTVNLNSLTLKELTESRPDLVKKILEAEDTDDDGKGDGGDDKGEEGDDTGTEARSLIAQAEKAGFSQEEIGKATNRAASIIGQIKASEIKNPPTDFRDSLKKLIASGKKDDDSQESRHDAGTGTELLEQNRELMRKVDALEAKQAQGERHTRRNALLTESKLPKEALSELFVEDVRDASTDKRAKALVEERKKIWFTQRPTSGYGAGGGGGKQVKDMSAFILSGKE